MKNLMSFRWSMGLLMVLLGNNNHHVFSFTTTTTTSRVHNSRVSMSSSDDYREDRMAEILKEEAMNAENLKRSAQEMQKMKPADIDNMLREMDNMGPAQMNQLKALGMDPDMMKETMKTMKSNPEMFQSVGKMMENMTPEQLLEQSRIAQERMKTINNPITDLGMSPTKTIATTTVAVNDDEDEDDEDDEEEEGEPIECDPKVLDTMYSAAEYMSDSAGGDGVTFQAFGSLPPITVLSGESGNDDLTRAELKEAWEKGSLGATRVDRSGFERVWLEVQDQYYNDIMEEARERLYAPKKKPKRGADKPAAAATATPTAAATTPFTSQVGAQISTEQLQSQVTNMSDSDVADMFDQMTNMTPEQEARMKAMGVDPNMMKQSAKLMKNNPMARKAATMMMKNASPEQLMKASQDAQNRMANMSDDEKKKFLGQ